MRHRVRHIRDALVAPRHAAPLAVFRILFGILISISMLRFYVKGWIESLYLEPSFHFSYFGLDFIRPYGVWTYLPFLVCGICGILVAVGYKYRASIAILFLSWVYMEMMDKTTYLNHYYLVSVLAFILIFLPMHCYFSIDSYRDRKLRNNYVPAVCQYVLIGMLSIVYFYAGLAKLNSDWLVDAMPLGIWLKGHYDIPLLGELFKHSWSHKVFSWGGALYDLCIPFLLWSRRCRPWAYVAVIVFHILTWVIFPIGMFPWLMIASALIFFSPELQRGWIYRLAAIIKVDAGTFETGGSYRQQTDVIGRLSTVILPCFIILQLLLPWRHLAYPGELFWTEDGYRFSWRVMLMEKAGYTAFQIVDPDTGHRWYVHNSDHLTTFQEKQMSTQLDFMVEYAHFLDSYYRSEGISDPEVYVDAYVALNGRPSRRYVRADVDLSELSRCGPHYPYLESFDDKIYGL